MSSWEMAQESKFNMSTFVLSSETWWKKCFAGFLLLFMVLASCSYSHSKSIILTQSLAFCTEAKYEKVLMMHVWGCCFAAPSLFVFFFDRCTFKEDCEHLNNSENWLDILSGAKKCPQIHLFRSSKDKVRGKIFNLSLLSHFSQRMPTSFCV